MSSNTRQEVLSIFERHRATPGAPYVDGNFLDYLLAAPKAKRAVHNSFRGLRRYNAFIQEVQMQYGIHFSGKDFDANLSLPGFVARVEEIRASRRASLASFRASSRRGFGWHAVVLLNLLAAAIVVPLWRWLPPLGCFALAAALIADVFVLRHYFQWSGYRRRLLARIEEALASET
jgi:hypothetical protein